MNIQIADSTTMSNSLPPISVIIPVFNSARFLPEALASIAAQTLAPLEIILVDGPSTDETPAIIRAIPNTVYLRQTGKNMWNALNEALPSPAANTLHSSLMMTSGCPTNYVWRQNGSMRIPKQWSSLRMRVSN